MFFKSHIPDDHAKRAGKSNILSVLHKIATVLSAMLVMWYLLTCIFSFTGALDDMRKFGGLGFTYSFQHYLALNFFGERVILVVSLSAEFLLYICQFCRAERKDPFRGSSWYFAVMVVLHTAIWMHANLILAEYLEGYYRTYANVSLAPSIVYFALYFLLIHQRSAGNRTGDGPKPLKK